MKRRFFFQKPTASRKTKKRIKGKNMERLQAFVALNGRRQNNDNGGGYLSGPQVIYSYSLELNLVVFRFRFWRDVLLNYT